MLRSKDNQRAVEAIVAIGRAYSMMASFDVARAKELAERLDRALAGNRGMESTYALCLLLLKAIDYRGTSDGTRRIQG